VFWDNVERWRPAVTEAVFAFGGDDADVHRFLRIMQCESAGLPDAKNPNSSASGLMQHLTRYWDDRADRAGRPGADVFDPAANIWVSAWLALAAPEGGWQHWVCK
jgi:muramidase (phage lysozyme)